MSKNSELAKAIAAEDAKMIAEAKIVRIELAKAEAAIPALKEKVRDIADGVTEEDEVLSALQAGRDVPEGALTFARERDERVGIALRTNENKVRVLRNSLPAADTRLADVIVPAVQSVIPGVEVLTTIAPLAKWRNVISPDAVAVVLVVDPAIEENPYTQTYSGTVRAYFIRSGLMRPLSVAGLEAAHRAVKTGVGMEVKSNVVGDEDGWVTVAGSDNGNTTDPNVRVLDCLTIAVSNLMDGLPIIREVTPNCGLTKTWTLNILSGFIRPGTITTAGVLDMTDLSDGVEFSIRYGMGSTCIGTTPMVSEEIDGGERTFTMKQVLNLTSMDPYGFAKEMNEGAADWVGGSHVGMGVLSSVEATPRAGLAVLHGNKIVDVVLVFKSRTAA